MVLFYLSHMLNLDLEEEADRRERRESWIFYVTAWVNHNFGLIWGRPDLVLVKFSHDLVCHIQINYVILEFLINETYLLVDY